MALYSKKLYYKRGGTIYSVDMFTTTAEVGSEYIGIRDGSTSVYIKIVSVDDPNESYLRLRKSGITKSLAKIRGLLLFSLNSAVLTPTPANYPSTTANGMCLVGTGSSPYVIRYDWSSTNNRYEKNATAPLDISPGGYPRVIGISGDAQFIAVPVQSSPFIHTYKYNSDTGKWAKTAAVYPVISTSYYGCYMASFNSDGSVLVLGNYGDSGAAWHLLVYKWNATNNRFEGTNHCDIQTPRPCYTAMINYPNYSRCIVPFQESSPYVYTYSWNATNNRYEKHNDVDVALPTHGTGGWVKSDGSRMVASSYNGFYSYIWNATNNRYQKTANPSPMYTDYPIYISAFNDGEYLAVGRQAGLSIFKWNATNNRYEEDSSLIDDNGISGTTNGTNQINCNLKRLVITSNTVSPYMKSYTFNG